MNISYENIFDAMFGKFKCYSEHEAIHICSRIIALFIFTNTKSLKFQLLLHLGAFFKFERYNNHDTDKS